MNISFFLQEPVCRGVSQLLKTVEDVRHLVSTFTTPDIDVQLRLGPSGHLLKGNGLAGSESSGYGGLPPSARGKR